MIRASRAQNEYRLVVVTGTSGLGLDNAGRRLAESLGSDWSHFAFESYLLAAESDVLGLDTTNNKTLIEFLLGSEPLLEAVWSRAFQTVDSILVDSLKQKNVVLTMHTSWWAPGSTTITPCVNYKLVANARWVPDVVVNLIDDIYDIYYRLSGVGQIFYPYDALALSDEIRTLQRLLDWRLVEFRSTKALATAVSGDTRCPVYLVSVKHPLATLVKLIEGDHRCVYLSHPISEVRRKGVAPEDATLNAVQRVSSLLRREFVLFEPTTIDEYRFRIEDEADDDVPASPSRASLTRRWPALLDLDGSDEQCVTPTPEAFRMLSIETGVEGVRNVSLVKELVRKIDEQINWRDRQLVIQSESLAVITPFSKLDGTVSGGVREEVDLHAKLCGYKELPSVVAVQGRFSGVIYHPKDDERNRGLKAIAAVLIDNLERIPPAGSTLVLDDVLSTAEMLAETLAFATVTDLKRYADSNDLTSQTVTALEDICGIRVRVPNSMPRPDAQNLSYPKWLGIQQVNERKFSRKLVQAFLGYGDEFNLQYELERRTPWAEENEEHFQVIQDPMQPDELANALTETLIGIAGST
ncbi:hypothetical protein Mycsm_06110 [Mycobacterium sp. JS623]|uniref:hypothetical protein n=1 Tax=Mycobacterium sp. JS623 TaxID=212767 RepID=UPI0002A57C3F|nr:hypothetical protein [Mycobacterium sp. JS623]AGB26269.1 hypothetical protein Mycsm_06110 [Mycobacterium sp. JS623]